MSEIPVKLVCRYGAVCEEIKDGAIHRCRAYIKMEGVDPVSGESISRFDCSDNWQVLATLEAAKQQKSAAAALESFRNEMVAANTKSQHLMLASVAVGVQRNANALTNT
jgi:hypothetical protein